MTREEKEKAYDEALKVIKGNLDALNEITETGAETVNIQSIKNCFYKAFPELKESEEDEKQIAQIERIVKNAGCAKMLQEKIHNWLKSLRSQLHWKPSEEQIEYLSKAILTLGEEGDGKTAAVLNELRKDLKKLMEE